MSTTQLVESKEVARPGRGWTYVRAESRPLAVAALATGALGLAVVTLGTFAVLTAYGWTPYRELVAGLQSSTLQTALWAGIALGVGGMAMGWGSYRSMPTKVSREESVAGAVLGVQALILGALLLLFIQGDVQVFVQNLLNFNAIKSEIDDYIFVGAKNTLILAAAGELFGIILGLILATFAISKRAVVRAPARTYINLFRGTPLLWQLMVIYFGFSLGLRLNFPTYATAILAFTLNTGAYSAEVFRAGIQSIERGQMEAARGLGMSYLQAMRYAVVPQAVRRVIPPLMNEFVILIKDTSLVIFLGLSASQRELLSVGQQGYSNTFNGTFFIAAGIGYLIITLPLIRIVNWVESRLRSGLVGVSG